MHLIKQADVYAPKHLGVKDILIIDRKIVSIADTISDGLPFDVEVIDATGKIIIPGLIDGHQHFTGGGGEGGFTTKVPEMNIAMNTENGVTSAVGLLGTDAITRNVESLYAKTQALNEQGLSAFMLTGSYWAPTLTLTGSIARDLTFLEPVIGLKLAIADHRGPHLNAFEIGKLASEVKNAALLGNKPGFITLHTGGLKVGLSQIIDLVENHEFSPSLFVPTHINRRSLLDDSLTLASLGVMVDATALNDKAIAGENKMNAAELIAIAKKKGLLDFVSVSSDAGGSLPIWNDDKTKIVGMGVGTPESMLFELRLLINEYGFELSEALIPFITNPAKVYGLESRKAQIKQHFDADLVIMEKDSLVVEDVFCQGKHMVCQGKSLIKEAY